MTAARHVLGDFPRQKGSRYAHVLPADLAGKTVLDIGCNAGFYSIEMKRRGAARVVGIDNDDAYLAQARFAASVKGIDIELRNMDVYDVGSLREKFDVVLFMGVLQHLRHPLLALDIVHDRVVGETMIFQSTQRRAADASPKLHFVEKRRANDATKWWIPNRACMEAMLRSAGFRIDANPEPELYVCTLAEAGQCA